MPRRHLQTESYQPCPLCGEPISTEASSCFHCGANDQATDDRPAEALTIVADYRTDGVHLERILPRRTFSQARFKNRRWLRGQNFQVIALMFALVLLLPLIGPLVMKLFGSAGS